MIVSLPHHTDTKNQFFILCLEAIQVFFVSLVVAAIIKALLFFSINIYTFKVVDVPFFFFCISTLVINSYRSSFGITLSTLCRINHIFKQKNDKMYFDCEALAGNFGREKGDWPVCVSVFSLLD